MERSIADAAPTPQLPPTPPAPQLAFSDSGRFVDPYHEVVDTGERKDFYGKTASHLILRTRTVPETGACTPANIANRDGWYVLNESVKPSRHCTIGGYVNALPMPVGKPCQDRIRLHGGFPPTRPCWKRMSTAQNEKWWAFPKSPWIRLCLKCLRVLGKSCNSRRTS